VAPHLHFQPDDELERGNRLDDLITKAVRADRERNPDEGEASEDEER
jgi:hypothetical protein